MMIGGIKDAGDASVPSEWWKLRCHCGSGEMGGKGRRG